MTRETLVCAEGVAPDRLSALRDQALPAGEAERLREHIAGCAACRARMADFDQIAGALRAQRELDPGDRILDGVHARLARRSGQARGWRAAWDAGGGRRVWAGLAALAPVAALILLFVYVFAGIGRAPLASPTPTAVVATPTPTWFKQIVPTATPALVQVPSFTPSVPAAQAWPTFKPAIEVTFKPKGGEAFVPNVFSPDLKTIGGVIFTFNTTTNRLGVRLAYYTTATGAITKLGPTWYGLGGPWGGVSAMDSRYIVYGYNSEPGTTCGVCNNTLWSLDRATGKTWQFNAGIGGVLQDFTSDDHVAFTSYLGQVWVADLAAHTVKVALPIGSQPYSASSQSAADERLLGFQWPYLLYAEAPAATPPAQSTMTLNVLDLATGVTTPVTSTMYDQSGNPVDLGSVMNLALVGKTLYANVWTNLNGVDAQGNPVSMSYGTLYRLDDYTSSDKFISVATWPEGTGIVDPPTMATRHLIWLGSGYFWDNAESRMVSTPLNSDETNTTTFSVQLAGSYIVAVDQPALYTPLQTYQAVAYGTSGFPTPPGW
jgi:putative zinc finger protein